LQNAGRSCWALSASLRAAPGRAPAPGSRWKTSACLPRGIRESVHGALFAGRWRDVLHVYASVTYICKHTRTAARGRESLLPRGFREFAGKRARGIGGSCGARTAHPLSPPPRRDCSAANAWQRPRPHRGRRSGVMMPSSRRGGALERTEGRGGQQARARGVAVGTPLIRRPRAPSTRPGRPALQAPPPTEHPPHLPQKGFWTDGQYSVRPARRARRACAAGTPWRPRSPPGWGLGTRTAAGFGALARAPGA